MSREQYTRTHNTSSNIQHVSYTYNDKNAMRSQRVRSGSEKSPAGQMCGRTVVVSVGVGDDLTLSER